MVRKGYLGETCLRIARMEVVKSSVFREGSTDGFCWVHGL